jgi:NAD-dependent DNA ligase
MTNIPLDENRQPVRGLHFADNEIKAVNTLYGIIMGITADGNVNDQEIAMLNIWLMDNDYYTKSFPLNIVKRRVADILQDGCITQEERDNFYTTLTEIMGCTFQETGAASGTSSNFGTEEPEAIAFDGATFCLTGAFMYGTRDKCEEVILKLGGKPVSTVSKSVDYLVIGSFASRDWIGTSHGRKIEKALHYQGKGHPIILLTEETWVKFVKS